MLPEEAINLGVGAAVRVKRTIFIYSRERLAGESRELRQDLRKGTVGRIRSIRSAGYVSIDVSGVEWVIHSRDIEEADNG